jgi:hypothetical protein
MDPIAYRRVIYNSFATAFFSIPLACGCAAYQVGSETLYAPDVETVYVPVIESNSLRRDLGERLTEAVIKDIELKTPYKVVGSPNADSVLSARLVSDARNVLVENAFDTPRVQETRLGVEVTWLNRRRMPIAPIQTVPLPPELIGIDATSAMIGEVGQSVVSAQNQAIERLSDQIVGTMEEPW